MRHTDMLQTIFMRLSSLWPINFQHHSQAADTELAVQAIYTKMAVNFMVVQQFKLLKKHKVVLYSIQSWVYVGLAIVLFD